MIREIVLDTETTGMDPAQGDRIVEIGCVELINHLPSGRTLQLYINPEREVPAEATAVHGITNEFLKDKPVFSQIYSEFVEFIEGARLIIHNAEFDMKFINYELKKVGHKSISWSNVVDTLAVARKKFPGSPASLDALCRRFDIDNSGRTYHGALLDSELLAEVYLELLGGRQHGLGLGSEASPMANAQRTVSLSKSLKEKPFREPRIYAPSQEETELHAQMIAKIKNPLWGKTA